MRFFKRCFVPAALVLLLVNVSFGQDTNRSISGKLVFENGDFSCDRCLVTLRASGVTTVATVYPDLAGHFSFRNVPPASFYTIHVEIEGFENADEEVDVAQHFGFETDVTIMLTRKTPVSTGPGGDVVNVSEFLDRYPKKAVDSFRKGNDLLRKKKTDDAVKYLENAVRLAPGFYRAHNDLGMAYKAAARNDDAEREFLRAHELNHTSVDPLLNLTILYIAEKKTDRAVTTSEEAVKADSRSAPAYLSLGMALYNAAMLDRAEVALKRALKLAPHMSAIRLMLANVYLRLSRYDSVLDQLNQYITEDPHGQQIQAVQEMRKELVHAKQADSR